MNAHDVMSTDVISIGPDTPIPDIARLLLDHDISAVPVVDDHGVPLGMVSEGDLIGRNATARETRKDWWLTLLAEGEALSPDFLASFQAAGRTARDVMSTPLVMVGEETEAGNIAQLLATHRVKRVPVLRDGRIVGIVSRADLLRALVVEPEAQTARPSGGFLAGALAKLDQRFLRHAGPDDSGVPDQSAPPSPAGSPEEDGFSVTNFQGLISDFGHQERLKDAALQQTMIDQRRLKVAKLIDQHVSDEGWRTILHKAHEAAEHGEKAMQLLQFPGELCSDTGRAINAREDGWPSTLRGEAAEIYLRWEQELKPRGFHLTATVIDFPGGKPGDIGLSLIWGE